MNNKEIANAEQIAQLCQDYILLKKTLPKLKTLEAKETVSITIEKSANSIRELAETL